MLRTLIKRVGIQGVRRAVLPVVPWMVIGELIEISYSVYKVVRDAREKKEKRREPR